MIIVILDDNLQRSFPWIGPVVYIKLYLTCVPGVNDEFGHLKDVSFHQPLTVNLHLTGVSDFRLTHHDLKWTVGHMFPVLLHTHHVFTHFLWCERDTCRQEKRFSFR